MNSIVLAITGFVVFYLGYQFYSRYIAEKIYRLDPNFVTPAHQFKDGVDFVPTNKHVLWGHHFSSVAGAAPILGPAIAIYWGWLPALLWVLLGTVFAAGVHDFGTLVISNRHKGQSMGTLTGKILGGRARTLFLFIIFILVLMVNAVFAWLIAKLFIDYPASVLPIWVEVPLAIFIGYIVYKKQGGKGLLVPSLAALFVMYLFVYLAAVFPALQFDSVAIFGGKDGAYIFWILILMAYGFISSRLPVWTLLQPRDYINSHQLFLGLAILYLGIFVAAPTMVAPMVNSNATDVSMFPLLFITIACGAISGFHGLVSSGTTSKQLNKETDARYVGYFGAIGEGSLALLSVIAASVAFATVGEWSKGYENFLAASGGALNAFVTGAAKIAGGLGISEAVGQAFVAVIVISFAATSLDTSVRLMRYILSELGSVYKVKSLENGTVATTTAVVLSTLLIFSVDGGRGVGSGGWLLWPLFGTANQLLAGISLLIIMVWLMRNKRNFWPVFVPMAFLLFMTVWAMFQQIFMQWMPKAFAGDSNNMILFVFGSIFLAFALWIILEAIMIVRGNKDYSTIDADTKISG